ncbi:uncharacterized protein N7529_001822 [Penicillium soppii]|uniref:uncharacterized protein n=1 Tax=Penicillium soppii TaxID=69789 RepID=UPI002547FFEC|nr:uncharacterized protein N7529_001822 [Penicillium soppii]KAJ5876238.1 hypothetical protein N7529_001822 [Penicillium soppii]
MATHSEPLHPEIYIGDPEFTSLFLPSVISDHASVQCQLDLYGSDSVGSKFGCINAHAGNFTSLCAPNCLPERLALICYTIDYGFIHDGTGARKIKFASLDEYLAFRVVDVGAIWTLALIRWGTGIYLTPEE